MGYLVKYFLYDILKIYLLILLNYLWYRERKEVNYLNLIEDKRERGTLRK